MKLNPFTLTLSLVRFTWTALSGIALGLHRGLQHRAALPIPAAPPPQTIDLLPDQVELLQVSEAVPVEPHPVTPHLLQDWTEETPVLDAVPPTSDRSQVVIALLDEAYAQGHSTYPALIAYVKDKTGTGCSRRVVAAWKQRRQLAESGEAA